MTIMHIPAALTMTSREIAELVEARHNDVVATIERLFSKGLLRSSRKTRREDTGGRPIEVYDLIERDTHLVVSGYSDEHRARVIDRWQELEGQQHQPAELSRMDILKLAMESEQARIEAIGANALGGGGVCSLRSDPLGKSFAQMLLSIPVQVPRHLLLD